MYVLVFSFTMRSFTREYEVFGCKEGDFICAEIKKETTTIKNDWGERLMACRRLLLCIPSNSNRHHRCLSNSMTFSATPEPIERLDSAGSEILDTLEKLRLEPAWIAEKRSEWGERVIVPEWEEDSYRAKNGWLVRMNRIYTVSLVSV
jgi:hypothetical protein